MNPHDLNTESRITEAIGEAVAAFAAPTGLKESLRKKVLQEAAALRADAACLTAPARGLKAPWIRSRWLVGGIAAAVLVAVGLIVLLSPGNGASLALADVQAATDKVAWVHVKFQGGGQIAEQWSCLRQGKWFAIRNDGDIVFGDNVKNTRLRYFKGSRYLVEDTPTIYPGGKTPKWEPQSAWQLVVGPYEDHAGNPTERSWIEKAAETVDGKRLVRFDWYYKDALGRQTLGTQLWADPETRLPVKVRYRLQIGERTQPGQEWMTGTFDFPDKGPEDIHALGVPAGLPTVKTGPITAEARAVIDKAKKAAQSFPKTYRLVTWTNDSESEIDVVWRDGERIRMNRYFNMEQYPAYHLSLPASAEQVLKWTETQNPMSIMMFADGRTYHRSNPYPKDVRAADRTEPTVHVSSLSAKSYFRTNHNPPTDYQWPFLDRGAPAEIVKDDPETPADCILLRFGAVDYRHDYYVDPTKNYMCIKEVHWRSRGGQLEKWREYWLFNLERASDTAWYATRHLMIDYGDAGKDIGRSHFYHDVHFTPLAPADLPAGIFDGKELLKGAKVEAD